MTITRRAFVQSTAALGAPLLLGLRPRLGMAADVEESGDPGRYAERAISAYQAMQTQYYVPSVQLYKPFQPMQGSNAYSYVWPFSQAYAATVDLLGLPGQRGRFATDVQQRVGGLAHYWNPTPDSHNPPSPPPSPPGYASYVVAPLGQGGDLFYDDNEWIALASLQQHAMTGDTEALNRAKAIFDVVRYGWDQDSNHPDPGGTYWTQAPWSHDRNTISNAPGAEVGVRLYMITKESSYLDRSKAMFDWVNRYMRASNGLYWDHVDLQGNVETTQWSYNQGVMLGAAALLYQATRDNSYLDQALDIATRALTFFSRGGRLFTQDVIFDAIFFKNLLFLSSIRPDSRYRDALRAYADTLWEAVDPSTGLLKVQPYRPLDLIVQAGHVQLNALLAWSPSDYHLLA